MPDLSDATAQLRAVLDAVRGDVLSSENRQARSLRLRLEGSILALDLIDRHTVIDRFLYDEEMGTSVGPETGTRIVGYLRVSTEEQAESGLGLRAQERVIRAEASRRGWTIVGIYTDRATSGKSLAGRNALRQALADLESGQAQALVVAKLDRLSRSLLDFAGLVARSNRRGWALVAIDLGVDTTTPAGKLVASVMASVSEWERDIIGQRTREALAVRRRDGVRLGRPQTLSADIVRVIVQARADGKSLATIAARLNDDAVPTARGRGTWYPSTVRAVLGSWAGRETP